MRTTRAERRVGARVVAAGSAAATLLVGWAVSSPAEAAGNTVTGLVFQDYNSNGAFDTDVEFGVATDIGVQGIIVEAFDAKGRFVTETTTAADGSYTLNLSSAEGDDFRIEFTIPEGSRTLSAFRSSFAGPDSGTSIQFVERGDENVDYGINVPGEFCQANPNIAVSRQCLGEDDGGNELEVGSLDVDDAPSLWVARYDGGPFVTARVGDKLPCPDPSDYVPGVCDPFVERNYSDVYVDWSATTAGLHGETKSIHGIAWDRRSGRIITSAFVRRNAQMYERVSGTPLPGALFTSVPNSTNDSATGATGGSDFLVDLEALMVGDQFSNSVEPADGVANAGFTGYIPSNAERGVPGGRTMDDPGAVDADINPNFDGVYEEAGKAGIGEIDSDDNGNLYVVSLYTQQAYRVALPANGSAPTSMTSIGSIVDGVNCSNGDPRPFGVEIWRNSAYFGVVCDGSDDYDNAEPNASDDDRSLTFSIRRYDLSTQSWSTFVGPVPLYGDNSGDLVKGSPIDVPEVPAIGPGFSEYENSLRETGRWNPWTDEFPTTFVEGATDADDRYVPDWERGGWAPVRPVPILSDIEFDRNGSIILGFRDRSTDQGSAGYRYPDGNIGRINGLNTGDIKRMCPVGATYVLEGEPGCPVNYINATTTTSDDEFYYDNYLDAGHTDIGAGMTEYVPGFPEVMMTGIDPFSPDDGVGSPADYSAGGVKWMLNSDGGEQEAINQGGGVLFYTRPEAPNNLGSFNKTNGMGDVEALCDQAPLQIGNRIWRDLDGDGVQDPGEPPIPGVTVHLYDEDGILVGTAITNEKGEYYFVSDLPAEDDDEGDEVGGGLEPNAMFEIRLDNPDDYDKDGPLYRLVPTRADVTDLGRRGSDRIDSDARRSGGYPSITVNPMLPGENDHDFDVGFVPRPRTTYTPPVIESEMPTVE